jgi:hypothetical protein
MSTMKDYLRRNRHCDLSGLRFSITCLLAIVMLAGGVFASLPATSTDAPVLALTRPSHQETIHDNLGDVPVVVTLQGTQFGAGRHLRVLLDGKSYGQKRHSLSFALEHVDRGEHTLSVALVDETDAVIATSPTITFYLWRASILFPIR